MSKKTILIIFTSYYLASCTNVPNTSNSQINIQELRSNYISLLSADEELNIALLNRKSMSQKDVIDKENKIKPLANKKCLTPYKNTLTKTLNVNNIKQQSDQEKKIALYKNSLKQTYQKSIQLDAALPSCLKPLGVSGQVRINYNGHSYSTPEYLQIVMARTDQLISISSKQNNNPNLVQDFVGTFADNMLSIMEGMAYAGTNNNQYYVQPYYRRDGTYVQGHYKTMPNSYCSDNIRGCQ